MQHVTYWTSGVKMLNWVKYIAQGHTVLFAPSWSGCGWAKLRYLTNRNQTSFSHHTEGGGTQVGVYFDPLSACKCLSSLKNLAFRKLQDAEFPKLSLASICRWRLCCDMLWIHVHFSWFDSTGCFHFVQRQTCVCVCAIFYRHGPLKM